MKPTKFRIYDKVRNEWLHDSSMPVHLLGEINLLDTIIRRRDESIVSLENLNDLEVMQYIGLKDKYNYEIFEGDIVRVYISHKEEYSEYIDDIRYSNTKLSINQFGDEPEAFLEILGNIYDNPNLLEELNG